MQKCKWTTLTSCSRSLGLYAPPIYYLFSFDQRSKRDKSSNNNNDGGGEGQNKLFMIYIWNGKETLYPKLNLQSLKSLNNELFLGRSEPGAIAVAIVFIILMTKIFFFLVSPWSSHCQSEECYNSGDIATRTTSNSIQEFSKLLGVVHLSFLELTVRKKQIFWKRHTQKKKRARKRERDTRTHTHRAKKPFPLTLPLLKNSAK